MDDYAITLAQQSGTVLTVDYDEAGRITASGGLPEEDYRNTLLYTNRRLLQGTGKSETHYVDFSAGAPVLTPRPELDRGFDKEEIGVREPATLADLPAAVVTFEGPVKGRHEHKGGDLVVGWTVPGTYTVRVEAFPYLPAEFVLTVGAAS